METKKLIDTIKTDLNARIMYTCNERTRLNNQFLLEILNDFEERIKNDGVNIVISKELFKQFIEKRFVIFDDNKTVIYD